MRDQRKRSSGRATASHLRLVHDHTPRVSPITAGGSRARDRIVIVPLDEPAPRPQAVGPVPPLAPIAPPAETTVDRRHRWPGREATTDDPHVRLSCPQCKARARIDLIDFRWGRVHLSCDRCFRMWQDRIREGDRPAASPSVRPARRR